MIYKRQPDRFFSTKKASLTIRLILTVVICCSVLESCSKTTGTSGGSYKDLEQLLEELKVLEKPQLPNNVPDYTSETMTSCGKKLAALRGRLARIDTSGWSTSQKVDYVLFQAEMNGLDFHLRILRPWARDPAFYALVWNEQSDTPSHEGPTSHALIDLWTYTYPLSAEDADRLASQLRIIPPLLEQAKTNLTGNAKDLWIAGIQNLRDQASELDALAKKAGDTDDDFKDALSKAKNATDKFADWLEKKAPSKTGPSGIGKENYTWHLRHVLLVPLSWEEEVTLLRRELDRAYAMLSLERHHNRKLPPLKPISSPEEFDVHADRSISNLMKFLKDEEILTVRDYMEPALRKHIGSFVPEEKRNFFLKVIHFEPAVLYTHATHWFDLARMQYEPHQSAFRREPLPFNIWMSRSEGLATGVEEMFSHAGLYDDNPRARELVWIMLAQRCARGLASLYAHANEITLEEARTYQIEWTPKGWMRADLGLVGFEQQLYLRQPGYGTSYVTGKYLVERLMKDRTRQLESGFSLRGFFDEMYEAGMIPVSLIRWQLTGLDDEIRDLSKGQKP